MFNRPFRFSIFLILSCALILVGCGDGTDFTVSSRSKPSGPQGLAQARTLADGTPHVALMVAPQGAGIPQPDLSHVRGRLFKMVEDSRAKSGASNPEEIRGRYNQDRDLYRKPLGSLTAFREDWLFRSQQRRPRTDEASERLVGAANQRDSDGLIHVNSFYSSDGYIVYECTVPNSQQSFTVTNGTVTGNITLSRSGAVDSNLLVTFNDEEPRIISFTDITDGGGFRDGDGPDPNRYMLSLVIPLECLFKEMDPDVMENHLGRWTVSASPQITVGEFEVGQGQDPETGLGLTPFDVYVSALVLKDLKGEYRDDEIVVDPVTGEERIESRGAVYTAEAKILPEDPPADVGPHPDHGNIFYRAGISAPGIGLVRTFEVEEEFSPGSTPISIDWDGKDENGNFVEGGHKYAISLWALIGTRSTGAGSEDILSGSGVIATVPGYFGPPDADMAPQFSASPNPWVPAPLTHEGRDIWVPGSRPGFENGYIPANPSDEDGSPEWPSERIAVEDENGEIVFETIWFFPEQVFIDGTLTQVDADHDGVPDIPPPEPRGIIIGGNVNRPGVDTHWTLHVRAEPGGAALKTFTSETANEPFAVEWKYDDINTAIEQESLSEAFFELHLGRCPTNQIELGISAQQVNGGGGTDGQGCKVPCFVVAQNFGPRTRFQILNTRIFPESNNVSDGPYRLFDVAGTQTPDPSDPQWVRRNAYDSATIDRLYPTVIRVGTTVFVESKVEFPANPARDPESQRITNLRVTPTLTLNGQQTLMPPIAVPDGQARSGNFPLQFRLTWPAAVGRHGASVTYKFEWEDVDLPGPKRQTITVPQDKERQLRLYSVIGNLTTDPGKNYDPTDFLWYNSKLFEGAVPKLGAKEHSPLDLATHLARGSVDARAAFSTLADNYYAEAEGVYTLVNNGHGLAAKVQQYEVFLLDLLATRQVSSRDCQAIGASLLRHLGLNAKLTRWTALPDTGSFAGSFLHKYSRSIGGRTQIVRWSLPDDIVDGGRVPRRYGFQGRRHFFSRGYGTPANPYLRRVWTQGYQSLVTATELDGEYIDLTSKTDQRDNPPENVLRIVNSLNVSPPDRLSLRLNRVFGFSQEAVEQLEAQFEEFYPGGAVPGAATPRSEGEFFVHHFYLWNDLPARLSTGFNDIGINRRSTLPIQLRID